MIKLIDEQKDGFCIFLNKDISVEIDTDLKMILSIQITFFQKEDRSYGVEYDLADYTDIFFKGKPIDNSWKKLDEWIKNYNNLMEIDLKQEINSFLDSYFQKYEIDPFLIINEFNIQV